MKKELITLLTDFGVRDHYVGAMKGVMLGICPDAQLVDITHDIAPYEITEAAYALSQAWPCFPKGTVHLVVIDPGVGSTRRALLAQAHGQFFIAPDNGVLTMVLGADAKHRVREITAEEYFRQPVSRTFHGRDIFSPVAAHVAAGVAPAKFGKRIEDYLMLHLGKPVRTARRGWTGTILKIDRFGNIITNFEWAAFRWIAETAFDMQVGLKYVSQVTANYAEIAPGEICAIEGSSGFIEVSAHEASAAALLGVGVGAPVELKAG